jgi:hypothetical protein
LFNYQINIKVGAGLAPARDKTENYDIHCGGKVKSDFTDIRFTAADGVTLLPYCKEKALDGIASFWVKVPQIARGDNKIYVYYGNSGAADLSNPEEVFDFYDDFKEDLKKWNVYARESGSSSIVNAQLKVDSAKVISRDYQIKDGVIEYQAKAEVGYENWFIIRGDDKQGIENSRAQVAYSSGHTGSEHSIAVGTVGKANDAKAIVKNTMYNYRIKAQGVNLTFERYDEGDKQASVSYEDIGGLTAGYIGMETIEGSVNHYYWVRTRKLAEIEPYIDSSKKSSEEKVNLPVFENITVSSAGNLVLQDEATTGVYLSKDIPTAFPTRVIVSKWKGASPRGGVLGVDISSDKGVTFKEDCANGEFYYASLGNFGVSSNILFRVRMSRDSADKESPQMEQVSLDARKGKVLVITPSGGEQWQPGTEEAILWSALNYESTYKMKLEYSVDGGQTYTLIKDKVPNTGMFAWFIPQDIVLTDEAKIRVSDAYCQEDCDYISDESDKFFSFTETGEEEEEIDEANTESWETLGEGELVPSASSEVVIDGDVSIVTEKDIQFKTLVIGDGKGEKKSKLILDHKISPASGDIIIRKGGELVQANNIEQVISGDLIVEAGGVLTHKANSEKGSYQINIVAQNIILEKNGIVTADARGYAGGEVRESGKGKGGGKYITKGNEQGQMFACGGSYGGLGGGIEKYGLDGEVSIYGKKQVPVESGSGGAGSWEQRGGAGGGVVRLQAKKNFIANSRISANGEDGGVSNENGFDGGGGAGGSIYLYSGVFNGERVDITASGGSGYVSGGGGSGGRIHIKFLTEGVISGSWNIDGGKGKEKGKGGTLVFEE